MASDKVGAVDGALGGGKLLDAVFTCGSAACQLDDTKPDPSKVKDITEISFRLAIGGSDEDTIPFTSLGLPSIGFLPDDGDLKVNLSWSVDVRIVADADGLRLAPAPGDTKELTLGATISLETDTFSVDLGALVVEAKTETDPRFSGQLQVDLNDDGSFSFGFGDNAGFSAAWKLETKDSPIPGVRGTLAINWPLEGDGVNPSELSIEVKDIAINAKQFVGEGMQDAAAAIRTITRPLRTATSPMMEPIPGLSDLSDAIGGGEVTMLKLMEQAKGASLSNPFPATDVSTFLTRLQRLDDVVAALEGDDNWVPLGSVKVVGDEALKPVGLAFDPAKLQGQLDNLIDKCGTECKERIDDLLTAVNGGATPGQGGFKFDLPVLNDPATLAGLLLGRDVDLVTFETGRLGYPRDNLHIPLARFLMFSVELDGAIEATFNVKGGVDTRGIIDALRAGASVEVVNGVYLQRPSDGGPIVRLLSEAELDFAAGFFGVGVEIGGGPKPDIALTVPASSPGGKLRPAVDGSGVGCKLLEADDAKATFGVSVTATFDYLLGEETEELASHTFLTEQDLCEPAVNDVEPAHAEGRLLVINLAAMRAVPAGEPDSVTVFMRHDPETGDPTQIVVTVNDNRTKDYPAADFDGIRYDSGSDNRRVHLRVVRADDKPFEKEVEVETGDGEDDVLVDSDAFGFVLVNGGNDKLIVRAGGALVSGGGGDDYVEGGDGDDVLGGGGGDDTIVSGGGNDLLSGDGDDDVLIDSDGTGNCLRGGPGNDQLYSGAGADFLNGDEGPCSAAAERDPEEDVTTSGDGDDVIITGGGADVVVGGGGRDEVRLDKGAIYDRENAKWRDGATVHGNGGADDIRTGNGPDVIHGGSGDDEIRGDAGPRMEPPAPNGGPDTIHGGLGEDWIDAGEGDDTVYGDNGVDTCVLPITGQPAEVDGAGGADTVYGGPGDDRIALEAGDDVADGGSDEGTGPLPDLGLVADGADVICGQADEDDIVGDDGDDTVFGGTAADTIDGEDGSDELFGNANEDEIHGGDGADRIVGGSSAAAIADTGDTISGGDAADVIIGDNGVVTGATPPVPSVFDLFAGNASFGGGDTIDGEDGEDRAFGGIGNDTIRGGDGDDRLEGNNGDDGIYGEADEDDIIGGTSPLALPGASGAHTAADASDGGETILSGGAGRDVIIGDNGTIARTFGDDPIIGGPARAVTLLDRDRTGTALVAVSGGDYVEGNEASDRLYGQGGADYIKGNEADDFVEGNQDGDRLEGNDGEDDLVGGSSFESSTGVGDPDGADRIAGGAGADVLLGDNAAITRATTGSGTGFDWDTVANSWLGPVARRSITLLDKDVLDATRFGSDELSGGAGEDVLFGQDGNDSLFGGPHDDYLEGNGAHDVIHGDAVAAPTLDERESEPSLLDGPDGPDGQDDMLGGSSLMRSTTGGRVTGQRDGNDTLYGDGDADVQLGDNGRILRRIVDGQPPTYQTHQATTGKPTIVRQAAPSGSPATALPARFDVGAVAGDGVWGIDTLYGGDGDDLQLGQDGDDTLYGGAADDDQYGELGNDTMFGEAGEDAMVGDRGVITNRLVTTPGASFSVSGPPKITFTPFKAHPLDRRVDLSDDGDGGPVQSPGLTAGGNDVMRGGPDHDSLHGAFGDDLMNGDSGGDYLFGDDGVDVMWGGKGRECADYADLECNNDPGTNDRFVDYLFGGHGRKTDPVTGGADFLDYRPRPGIDPAAWFEATSTGSTDPLGDHQHHQGIDWIYGGMDRDVMQANVADNGPNLGDRLIDWTGAYNLYTHCPAAYGGYNDIKLPSPSLQSFLEQLAHAVGAGKSLADVRTKGTSGYRELALVYNGDVKSNSGTAYPTTPGHFDIFACTP